MNKIRESVNDKNLFKAVFMAGGPGSGKSMVSSNMFSFKDGEVNSFNGAKLVNSDTLFELMLKKNNLPMKMNQYGDPDVYAKQMDTREKARALTGKKQDNYINGMLPLIIDGTGKDYNKITNQALALRRLGYDVSMIFVNTSLDTALRRNAKRERSVDEDVVKDIWSRVQNNLGKFQDFFGPENFLVVDSNTDYKPGSDETKEFTMGLFKKGEKLLNRPLQNPRGIKTLEYLQKTGKKYLSDIPEDDHTLKESCKEVFGFIPWAMIHSL